MLGLDNKSHDQSHKTSEVDIVHSLLHALIDMEISACNLHTEDCVCKYQLMYPCMYMYRIRVISVLSQTDLMSYVVIIPLRSNQYEG